jgi:hypothetical protein
MRLTPKLFLSTLLLAGLFPCSAWSASVVFVKGDVRMTAGESYRQLARGMAIDEAATLESLGGFAQIRLSTGQLLSVRPGDILELAANLGDSSEDNESDASARRIKALLRKASGSTKRASRATFPEQVLASGDTSALEIVNSLNFSTTIPADNTVDDPPPAPDVNATSMVGVLPGGGSQMTLAAQSSNQGVRDEIHIEAVVADFGVSRDDGSSVHPLDRTAGSLTTQTTNDATGITWGRWVSGQGRDTGVGAPFEFSEAALHALMGNRLVRQMGDSAAYFASERTGTANYELIGFTDPTDNFGQSGQLGSASLHADFDQDRVTVSVELNIAQTLWQASGSGALEQSGLFDGAFSSVTASDQSGLFDGAFSSLTAGDQSGTGEFMGFLQGASEEYGTAAGAGLSYLLESGNQRVGGVAAFIEVQE